MEFIEQLKEKAGRCKQRIVLPEGLEERTLKAANQILEEDFADIVLIGNPAKVKEEAGRLGLGLISKAKIVDPLQHDRMEAYTDLLFELRKSKGLSREQAAELVKDPLYLAVLMIKNGDA